MSGNLSKSVFHKRIFVISERDYYLNILIFLSSFVGPVSILIHSCFLSSLLSSSPNTHTSMTLRIRLPVQNYPYTMVTISHGRSPNYGVPIYMQQFLLCSTPMGRRPWHSLSRSRHSIGAAASTDTQYEKKEVGN